MSRDADLDRFYGNLHNYVEMVTEGYSNLLMLDAKGGLGKTYNVKKVLDEQKDPHEWHHAKGFTTPIELYKTLWQSRKEGSVLFLDDMSGVTSNTKAIDMLKAATDTDGEENWVEYSTSRDIDNPNQHGAALPNTFCFRGTIIMSFNDTPDNRHFDALKDRGTFYRLRFTHPERIELIKEVAKKDDFSRLPVRVQRETADWIDTITDASYEVTIRTFEEVCNMRAFASGKEDASWQKMALEVFDKDYEKHLIIDMRENSEMPVEQQRKVFCEKTDKSETYYYDLLGTIKSERRS
jgi:hypothetical protein